MVDLEITYCQPCGHQPTAVDIVSQLLAIYGLPLNRKLTISLKPADKGVFDVVLDGQLIFSKHQQVASRPWTTSRNNSTRSLRFRWKPLNKYANRLRPHYQEASECDISL